jgi:hypothetical protein
MPKLDKDKLKVKLALCKDCGGWIMQSTFPTCETRADSRREFNKLIKQGHDIDVVTLREAEKLKDCYTEHAKLPKANAQPKLPL